MNDTINKLSHSILAALVSMVVAVMPAVAQGTPGDPETLGREVGVEVESEILAIDLQTREISLSAAMGLSFTVYAPEQVINLADISVGDRILGKYSASVEAEVREPGEAELAEPWKVLEDGVVSGSGNDISVEKARIVRAVVTIAGINKAAGVIIVTDSRGLAHFIAHVEPETMESVAVGQQVVVVFSESMAITFERKS